MDSPCISIERPRHIYRRRRSDKTYCLWKNEYLAKKSVSKAETQLRNKKHSCKTAKNNAPNLEAMDSSCDSTVMFHPITTTRSNPPTFLKQEIVLDPENDCIQENIIQESPQEDILTDNEWIEILDDTPHYPVSREFLNRRINFSLFIRS